MSIPAMFPVSGVVTGRVGDVCGRGRGDLNYFFGGAIFILFGRVVFFRLASPTGPLCLTATSLEYSSLLKKKTELGGQGRGRCFVAFL